MANLSLCVQPLKTRTIARSASKASPHEFINLCCINSLESLDPHRSLLNPKRLTTPSKCHSLQAQGPLVHRRATTRANRSSDAERPEPERASGTLRSFRAIERLQGGNSPLSHNSPLSNNSPLNYTSPLDNNDNNEAREAHSSPVLWPEIVEDESSGPRMTSPGRADTYEEGPSPAELAKARWLVDREASGNDFAGERSGGFDWATLPLDAMRRMRRRLGGGGGREGDAEETDSSGGGQRFPFRQKMLRKAERRGISSSSSGVSSSPSSGEGALRVPSSILFIALSLGCAVAIAIAYQARAKFPFAGTALTAAVGNQMLGHVAVDEAPESDLTPVLADRSVLLRTAAANAFLNMQSEARSQGVFLLPLSGFRSVKVQQAVFFGVKASRNQNIRDRAKVSAPPGYSEHHTGYALDIGDACEPSTHLEFDFENTDAFHWLQSNANSFHFELSFPPNNEQGIMYEPWHWRFVGNPHAALTFYGGLKTQAGQLSSR